MDNIALTNKRVITEINKYYQEQNFNLQNQFGHPSENKIINEIINSVKIIEIDTINHHDFKYKKNHFKKLVLKLSFKINNQIHQIKVLLEDAIMEFQEGDSKSNHYKLPTWKCYLFVQINDNCILLNHYLKEQSVNDRYFEVDEWLNNTSIFEYIKRYF